MMNGVKNLNFIKKMDNFEMFFKIWNKDVDKNIFN